MVQLIGVHGISQQYKGRSTILREWLPTLQDGLEAANDHRPVGPPNLDLAFYGDLFRSDPGSGKGTAEGDARAALAGMDADELADLTETVTEIVPAANLTSAEEAASIGKGVWVPVSVASLIGAVERRFPGTSGALFLGDLRQVGKYLRDRAIKAKIDTITEAAAVDADVLIGHSLGSVVAYEYLRQHPGHSVQLLLTLGSPLGLKMVRKRLPPGGIGETPWVTLRDDHDPVAAAGRLDQWYPGVRDETVANGTDAHSAERYLTSPACGRALLEILPELAR